MKGIRGYFLDRRRSQRGGVLSGVLIMTLFIAIIAGALLTELSTNLLVSHVLINRVANQATENSALELSLSQLQATQLNAPCPPLTTTPLNGVTAVAAYSSCWPTVAEPHRVASVGGSGNDFETDGTHAQVNGVDDWVVGDAGANVFDVPFGSFHPRWTLALGGEITATPLVIAAPGGGNNVLDAIPVTGPACLGHSTCVAVYQDTAGSTNTPQPFCVAPATGGAVQAQPAASVTQIGSAFFGSGDLLMAYDLSGGGAGQTCEAETNTTIPGGRQVVAQPLAFRRNSNSDYVYVVAEGGGSDQLLEYSYDSNHSSFSLVSSLGLFWSNVSGLAVSGTALPTDLAVTFAGGGVAFVHLALNGAPSLGATPSTGSGVADAPYWCHCPTGDLVGVGTQAGGLILYSPNGQPFASLPPGGSPIETTPGADAAGNWYFGANDGSVHEVQVQGGPPTLTQVEVFGPMGATTSAVMVGGCPVGICVYLAASDQHAYLVPLDARKATITACITTAPPVCSGPNPHLWARVQVGSLANSQAVRVEGWSYYSG